MTSSSVSEAKTGASVTTVTLKGIVEQLADGHDLPKKQAGALLAGMIETMTTHLKSGDRIRISGIGTLEVRQREARTGRNPATGADRREQESGLQPGQGAEGSRLRGESCAFLRPASASAAPSGGSKPYLGRNKIALVAGRGAVKCGRYGSRAGRQPRRSLPIGLTASSGQGNGRDGRIRSSRPGCASKIASGSRE
jgi:DNA-binding protein HU-beta